MGDFTSKTDLLLAYQGEDLIRLTQPDGSVLSVVNDNVLDVYIERAEAIIKGFIQPKYSLPFNVVPEMIKHFANVLTYYYLHERKFSISAELQTVYQNVMDILSKIQSGELSLDTLPGVNDWQTLDTQGTIGIDTDDRDITEGNLELM